MVFEVTGNTSVAREAQNLISVNGIISYLGIYRQEQATEDAGKVFTDLVLGNRVRFGSVNANKIHFLKGVMDLSRIKDKRPGFLEKIITGRVKPSNFAEAYAPVGEGGKDGHPIPDLINEKMFPGIHLKH